ncbi:UNKNOWN [Stylonychia lemnae]|uniref:RING-type domain-containing protein n=1 Tax=Stylonychia lemnae TaxID=5949 RepID=A0A078AUI8_STYLE|nr:UNKNOWN [Stylonychia lemnae]|eukprot:CDW84877.1 UNKNOWN [Stylonychia lemnae]
MHLCQINSLKEVQLIKEIKTKSEMQRICINHAKWRIKIYGHSNSGTYSNYYIEEIFINIIITIIISIKIIHIIIELISMQIFSIIFSTINIETDLYKEQPKLTQITDLDLKNNKKPVKEEIIHQLPDQKYKKNQEKIQFDDKEQQCSICMTDFEDGDDMKILMCFHKFHKECILDWFKEQNFCPICRINVNEQK